MKGIDDTGLSTPSPDRHNPLETHTVNAATTPDETGSFSVRKGIDDDIRQDVTSAAWLMAAATLPGLAVLVLML